MASSDMWQSAHQNGLTATSCISSAQFLFSILKRNDKRAIYFPINFISSFFFHRGLPRHRLSALVISIHHQKGSRLVPLPIPKTCPFLIPNPSSFLSSSTHPLSNFFSILRNPHKYYRDTSDSAKLLTQKFSGFCNKDILSTKIPSQRRNRVLTVLVSTNSPFSTSCTVHPSLG